MDSASDAKRPRHGSLAALAAVCAVVPTIAAHGAWLAGVYSGELPQCFPYAPDCVSISATGRQDTGHWIFKPGMLICAIAMGLFWARFPARWLSERPLRPVLKTLGITAAGSLVVYTVTLGMEEYRVLRHSGIMLWFGLTFLAQLLTAIEQRRQRRNALSAMLFGATTALWLLGLATVLLAYVVPTAYSRVDNAFEWLFALLIMLNYGLLAATDTCRRTSA